MNPSLQQQSITGNPEESSPKSISSPVNHHQINALSESKNNNQINNSSYGIYQSSNTKSSIQEGISVERNRNTFSIQYQALSSIENNKKQGNLPAKKLVLLNTVNLNEDGYGSGQQNRSYSKELSKIQSPRDSSENVNLEYGISGARKPIKQKDSIVLVTREKESENNISGITNNEERSEYSRNSAYPNAHKFANRIKIRKPAADKPEDGKKGDGVSLEITKLLRYIKKKNAERYSRDFRGNSNVIIPPRIKPVTLE